MYGFRKLKSSKHKHTFTHPNFLRDQPQFLINIKRNSNNDNLYNKQKSQNIKTQSKRKRNSKIQNPSQVVIESQHNHPVENSSCDSCKRNAKIVKKMDKLIARQKESENANKNLMNEMNKITEKLQQLEKFALFMSTFLTAKGIMNDEFKSKIVDHLNENALNNPQYNDYLKAIYNSQFDPKKSFPSYISINKNGNYQVFPQMIENNISSNPLTLIKNNSINSKDISPHSDPKISNSFNPYNYQNIKEEKNNLYSNYQSPHLIYPYSQSNRLNSLEENLNFNYSRIYPSPSNSVHSINGSPFPHYMQKINDN